MGTAVPKEGNKYKQPTMNRLIALFAVVAVACAEPEADPQYLVGYPHVYSAAHHTAGLVQHPGGAVVPDDTMSVKAAKVQHHVAKAVEYAKKPFVYSHVAPYVYSHQVAKPVAAYTYPRAYTTPYLHRVKREADSEADSQYYYNAAYPMTYSHAGVYPYASTYAGVYPTYPYTYAGPHYVKRSADSEADSQYYYNSAYTGYPYAHY